MNSIDLRVLITFFVFFFSFTSSVFSAHITGGYLTYECLGKHGAGSNQYEITITVFKDCNGTANFPIGNTPFDKQIGLRVFDGMHLSFISEFTVTLRDTIVETQQINGNCITYIDGICSSRAIYIAKINLPDNPNGYHLTWSRCCRAEDIINLINPVSTGMVFSGFIPSTNLCNNSPLFINELPSFINSNEIFSFDFSAIDIDGDSLRYEISHPKTAGDRLDPIPTPSPPPHATVNFLTGYSANNPFGATQGITIEPNTGLLNITPGEIGKFVFALTVKEYRNGLLISELPREILIEVISPAINMPPEIMRPISDQVNKDTLSFFRGMNTCFTFSFTDMNTENINQDKILVSVEGGIMKPEYGASFNFQPDFSNATGTICWMPDCELTSLKDSLIIIKIEEENSCNGPIFDTMYVKLAFNAAAELLCEESKEADVISVLQNFPNPFSIFTKFLFTVNSPGKLTLDIFDARGRRIETLLDEFHQVGNYQFIWEPNGLARGLYYCRFRLGDEVITKKMFYQD